ncbi:protein KHNYN [Synchiropus picturatus]
MASEIDGRLGGGPVVEDEFTCSGMQLGSLTSIHDSVERIFKVCFKIEDDTISRVNNRQIWLKLQGSGENVTAAKLFVKGVVNQEEQKEVSYPPALKCVFCGAKGLFLDSLIKSTSAHILIGSPGYLHVSGLAEPVVRAYSLITDMIERYNSSRSKHTEKDSTGLMETLESRRAFKALVEKWEDRHTLDLLVLPGSVKEVLLNLVHESGHLKLTDEPVRAGVHEGKGLLSYPSLSTNDWSPAEMETTNNSHPASLMRSKGAGADQQKSHLRVWGDSYLSEVEGSMESEESLGNQETQQSTGNHEFFLKFFTAMGYTEDAVKRVLSQAGPKEASQMLDLVQHEQDIINLAGHQNQPCETEHREEENTLVKAEGILPPGAGNHSDGERSVDHEGDFVLGVMKKAALSCGYKEQKVSNVYSRVPVESSHQLLLELQKEGITELDVSSETEGNKVFLATGKPRDHLKPVDHPYIKDTDMEVPNLIPSESIHKVKTQHLSTALSKTQEPVVTHPTSFSLQHLNLQSSKFHSRFHQLGSGRVGNPQPEFRLPESPLHAGNGIYPSRRTERGSKSSAEVTGEQRFLEGLQTPFNLRLMDKPGNPSLRMIVIDGSNVAMSHGLGHFFSCRGIALAVQHFWDRGHREISALLPQWRLKSDSRIKEQHYLMELQKLGLVSFTPSREVQGMRINSYDDRLMLQLAEKKNGVIVTNDNLRDLLDDSPVWRDIIKKRLLQYTFVGDLFMVPDDPLGRNGPHLNEFLLSDLRPAHLRNHPSLGVAGVLPPSQPFRFQTELVNYPTGAHLGPSNASVGSSLGKSRQRTVSETSSLKTQLCQVFPGQDSMVTLVLQSHPAERDINVLSELLLQKQE